MSIATYSELQTAVATRINRSDLTSAIPDFITIGEAKLNRRLRLREQEQLSYAEATKYIALPTGFIELLDLRIRKESESDYQYTPLRFVAPDQISRYYRETAEPTKYTIRDQIELNSNPDDTYRVLMHYLKRWDIETDTTNWLLTNYPEIYLYSSLVEAADHIADTERQAMWIAKLNEVIEEAQDLDERSRNDAELDTSHVSLMYGSGSFDINRG